MFDHFLYIYIYLFNFDIFVISNTVPMEPTDIHRFPGHLCAAEFRAVTDDGDGDAVGVVHGTVPCILCGTNKCLSCKCLVEVVNKC